MYINDIQSLAVKIFDKGYRTLTAPIVLEAVAPAPNFNLQTEYCSDKDGVSCTVDHSSERDVVNAMYGHTRYIGTEEVNDKQARAPIEMILTMNQMAEIIDINECFVLMDPNDASDIYDTVLKYHNTIHDEALYSLNDIGPPQEDIIKLKRLLDAIKPLASKINSIGQGTGTLAELQAIFSFFGNFAIGRDSNSFFKQKPPSVSVKPIEEEVIPEAELSSDPSIFHAPKWTTDPYKF